MFTQFIKNLWGGDQDKEQAPVSSREQVYTDVTILLDRSASMASMQSAVVEGFNSYVKKMRENPGDNKWSLVQFDDPSSARGAGESFPSVTFSQCNEREIPLLCKPPSAWGRPYLCNGVVAYQTPNEPLASGYIPFIPRGRTALVDAMYQTVESIEARLSGQTNIRPVVMVITDGEENLSREHSSEDLREIVARTQAKGFEYIYLGANQDSFAQARKYGISTNMGAYATVPVHLGGIDAASASCTNNFAATNEGMRAALLSGFVGCAAISSGAVASGIIIHYQNPSQNQVWMS